MVILKPRAGKSSSRLLIHVPHLRSSALLSESSTVSKSEMEKIIELFEAFDPERGANLRTFVEGQLKDSVDSIVANRNAIVPRAGCRNWADYDPQVL